MADGFVPIQRLRDGFGRYHLGLRDRQRHRIAARFTGEADHLIAISPRHRDQDPPARRDEGANGGFRHEMAAVWDGQYGMLTRSAIGEAQQTLAHAGIDGSKIEIPRCDVDGERFAHLRPGRHRSRD